MILTLTTKGLDDFAQDFADFPQQAAKAAQIAVNYAADRFARKSSNAIKESLRIESKSLYNASDQKKSRIKVRKAGAGETTAVVSASSEPYLLSKFATNAPKGRSVRGISPAVMVKPSNLQKMESSFYVRAKNGQLLIALRLKPGESVRNRTSGRTYPLRKGDPSAVVLYGPSIDQAFETQSRQFLDSVEEDMRAEYQRQFRRLTNG